ncbi:adenylosuccinate lyase [Roseivivax sp. THAF30]|uniref:adenylosuccinate lyase n=1 Tax=Roseivivax sp. THAF30 TaxID=2587852 RepID=UPI00126884C1|nr:adenylosuccinate lyase [Roseivivax sp. THAF30]QFT63421.1 hypothetical protein FIU91_10840 [Roseivivax sp. THAF30]
MIKTALAAAFLTVASTLSAFASCGYSDARMTCADGMIYDSETGSCQVVTG